MSSCDCQHFSYWEDGNVVLIRCDSCQQWDYTKSQYHARDWANKHAGKVSQ